MDEVLLRKTLINEGYVDGGSLESTIKRLLNLDSESSNMLNAWLINGEIPSFDPINGIDSEFLIKQLHMKIPAVILAHSMLVESPQENSAYLRSLITNRIDFIPSKLK